MLLKSSGLRVYITDASGAPLPEYQQLQTKEDSIECWVPSVEGANFQIHWEILNRTPTTVGCCSCATPYFDGVKLKGKIAPSGRNKGRLYGHPVAPSMIRLYQFGKRKFTDEEDTSVADAISSEDLGTIRLKIQWGQSIRHENSTLSRFTEPVAGPVNEKLGKKGFWDSAGLGQTAETRRQAFGKFVKKEEAGFANFLFRYASEDFLMTQGIIPLVPKTEPPVKSESLAKQELLDTGLSRKRTRAVSPEANESGAIDDENDEAPTPQKCTVERGLVLLSVLHVAIMSLIRILMKLVLLSTAIMLVLNI
ncbi:hypothetical protein RSOLAG1IB_07067 [Rhizoctonia solani AG-1 IB]|uniref:DUF7918 domain-containing protein n=1 Tax=Thanatephorus cucumeris (strain AG1-IB / isolate 7/3/14) TaxID=1108050 RepID=A0A0B7FBY9_THACB|nr:hypothetical protein RSOLAG1IB_07067 [Rhizoctonia solani AG-1 IB]